MPAPAPPFSAKSYGYAVFPTVGEAGFIVGGAYGKGRVYVGGKLVGDTTMTQLSAGFQLGGKGYSQIIFFEDKRAFDEFATGSFEFSAGVERGGNHRRRLRQRRHHGRRGGASGGKKDATTASAGYEKGMAVFTIAKGGLMYTAAVAGQKFSYKRVEPLELSALIRRRSAMNATWISLAAFGCTMIAALAAIFVRERLPAHHLKGDSQEFLKLVLGLIATITALVLGLLISSAHSNFDSAAGRSAASQRRLLPDRSNSRPIRRGCGR